MSNFNEQSRNFSVKFRNSVLNSFLGYESCIDIDKYSKPTYNTETFLQIKFENKLFPWVPTFLIGNLFGRHSDINNDTSPLELVNSGMNYPIYITPGKPHVVESIGDSFISFLSSVRTTIHNVKIFDTLYVKDLDEVLYVGDGILLDSKFNILMCNYLLLKVNSGIIMGSKLVISKALYGNSNKLSSVFKNRYVPAVLQSELNSTIINIREEQKSAVSKDSFIYNNISNNTHKRIPTYYSPKISVEIGNDFDIKVNKTKKNRNIITNNLKEVCNNALNNSGNSVAKIFSV